MAEVFDFIDYKKYLVQQLGMKTDQGVRGVRSRLAEAIECQPAYVTRVLDGDAQLSMEQAEATNLYLGHGDDEADFFLLLTQLGRAGTQSLRARLTRERERRLTTRFDLKNRLAVRETLSEQHQLMYFNRWQNAAVHMALLVPSLGDKEAIAKRLEMPMSQLNEAIDLLVSFGLIARDGDRFTMGAKRLHLGKDDLLIARHHTNWRMRAIHAIDRDATIGLHYSSVVSIAKGDVAKIHEMLVRAIADAKAVIKDSREETLASFCLDFYEF